MTVRVSESVWHSSESERSKCAGGGAAAGRGLMLGGVKRGACKNRSSSSGHISLILKGKER